MLDTFLEAIAHLSHKDLRDLLDMFEINRAVDRASLTEARKRRRGRADYAVGAVTLWGEIEKLTPIEYRYAEKIIDLLYNALKPKALRKRLATGERKALARSPIARGHVQVKTIPRERLNSETKTLETFYYRYVYIRLAESGGGIQGVETHQKTVYIRGSRGLAYALDVASPIARADLVNRILDAYENSTLPALVSEYEPLSIYDPIVPQEFAGQLLKSQKGLCWWCGCTVGNKYHVDHRVPYSRGGSNDLNNLCITCPKCNHLKANKLPHEWSNRLL